MGAGEPAQAASRWIPVVSLGARSASSQMARQTLQAVAEADAVLLLVDGRAGLTPEDRAIAQELRKTGRRLWLVVNKSEGRPQQMAAAEFHELGLGQPWAISAAHGDGVNDLLELVLEPFAAEQAQPEVQTRGPKIAVVGRPNVGKSTWSTPFSAKSG
jgi:GTP-binding protein